jgi:hypothetical protein
MAKTKSCGSQKKAANPKAKGSKAKQANKAKKLPAGKSKPKGKSMISLREKAGQGRFAVRRILGHRCTHR